MAVIEPTERGLMLRSERLGPRDRGGHRRASGRRGRAARDEAALTGVPPEEDERGYPANRMAGKRIPVTGATDLAAGAKKVGGTRFVTPLSKIPLAEHSVNS
jgi:hypothetical protein